MVNKTKFAKQTEEEFPCDKCEFTCYNYKTLSSHKTRKHPKVTDDELNQLQIRNTELIQQNKIYAQNIEFLNKQLQANQGSTNGSQVTQLTGDNNNLTNNINHNNNTINIVIDAKNLPEFEMKKFADKVCEGMVQFNSNDLDEKGVHMLSEVLRFALHDESSGLPTVLTGDTSRKLFKKKENNKIIDFQIDALLEPIAKVVYKLSMLCSSSREIECEKEEIELKKVMCLITNFQMEFNQS